MQRRDLFTIPIALMAGAATSRFVMPVPQAAERAGTPVIGERLYFYQSGTHTPKNSFTDVTLTVPNTNPVVADAVGRFPNIFLAPGEYKVVLEDASGATIWTADPVGPGGTAVALGLEFTADGVGASFPLPDVWLGFTNPLNFIVTLDGVQQPPETAYMVAGGRIVFDEAPVNGTKIYIRNNGAGVTAQQGREAAFPVGRVEMPARGAETSTIARAAAEPGLSLGIPGEVRMWAGASAPSGWMLCQGQTVSRATYARLFAVIGTVWGAGDGSTTFNLPYIRGALPLEADPGLNTRTLGDGRGLTHGTAAGTGADTTARAAVINYIIKM